MINKELWFCITKKPPFYEVEQMNTCTYSLCTQL
jgi:hypothetical protein